VKRKKLDIDLQNIAEMDALAEWINSLFNDGNLIKARKEYDCFYCKKKIKKGEYYLRKNRKKCHLTCDRKKG